MPSKTPQYDLVPNDEYDTRVPMHSEEAFHHGISFQARFIGSLDIPRPTTRAEIIAAMRKIRHEYRMKGIKKEKVAIEISIDGVRVSLRNKKKQKKAWVEDNKLLLMSHPIYRIFYVSHDSQDSKIFSYIVRERSSNAFRCNVFKSKKKNQAMSVVRTVGQAFEVCHKLSEQGIYEDDLSLRSETSSVLQDNDANIELIIDKETDKKLSLNYEKSEKTIVEAKNNANYNKSLSSPKAQPKTPDRLLIDEDNEEEDRLSTTSAHEIKLLREQLEQQTQQTQAAVAQLQLLRDHLAAERSARMEAQARTHQLLANNKELLDHITALVAHLQKNDRRPPTLPLATLQPQQTAQPQQQQQQPTPAFNLVHQD